MSAECEIHGVDLHGYPEHPQGLVCPVCERVTERDAARRLFNRMDAAISRHRKAKEGTGFCDDADAALHAAHDKVLKAAFSVRLGAERGEGK